MALRLEFWPTLAFIVLMMSWFGFAAVFLVLGNKSKSPPDRKRAPGSLLGVLFQAGAYAIVWVWHRQYFSPIIPMGVPAEIVTTIVISAISIGSAAFVLRARQALGKEWSVTARLVQGHKLVTEGPYGIVRNPIYTGMFGLLLATGLVVSHWMGLLIAVVVFAIGTAIRVRSEEKLLRKAFGAEFDAYARKVPAVVPFLF